MIFSGLSSLTDDLAQAIARMEGACTSGTCRNNNPGNLRTGPGATGVDSRGIAVFPDYATGEAALERQIDRNIARGLTLQEFFTGKAGVYDGYDKTNPTYAQSVAQWTGIDPNVPLEALQGGYNPSGDVGDGSVVPDDPGDTGGQDSGNGAVPDSGLSTGALVGLGIAGLAVLWAVTS